MEKGLKDALMGYGALAGIIAVAISTFYQYNIANDPEARADSYTGTRGSLHEARTTELEKWKHIVDLQLQALESARSECRNYVSELRRDVDSHEQVSKSKILEYNVMLREHSVKIDQCLKRMRYTNDY